MLDEAMCFGRRRRKPHPIDSCACRRPFPKLCKQTQANAMVQSRDIWETVQDEHLHERGYE